MVIKSCRWFSWTRKKVLLSHISIGSRLWTDKVVLHGHQNTCHGDTYWQGHWCPWRVPSTALPWHPRTRLGHQPLPDLPSHSAQAGCHGLGMPLSNFVLQLKLSQPCVAFLLPLPLLSASGWRGELEAQKVKIRWEQVS